MAYIYIYIYIYIEREREREREREGGERRRKQIILINVVFNNTQKSCNLGKAARKDKRMIEIIIRQKGY